jgi:general secretion pathway protein A
MYTAHFGLKATPFSITPDPHYLYLSANHREALAHLSYGVNEGPGFVLLTGEVGTGKTTLCRTLIEQLPETVDVALLLNPRLTAMELLAALFDELKIHYDSQTYTLKDFTDTLTSYLLTAHAVGRHTVVILDEAQNFTIDVLEQVRLLTNLETSSHKLLQIVLVGQPELNKLLAGNNLRQISQRITARYHLLPLSAKDTRAYIEHRLAISGAKSPLFTDSAMRLVYRYSGGIPRLINNICDRALFIGYGDNQNQINNQIVRKAVWDVHGKKNVELPLGWLIGIVATVLLVGWWWIAQTPSDVQNSTNSTTPPGKLTISPDVNHVPTEPSLPLPPKENPQSTDSDAEPTSPVPAQSLVNLLSSLQTSNTKSAFVTLFKQWDLDYTRLSGEDACKRAATQGLACLLKIKIKTGTWENIRSYNRPTMIELVTEDGQQYHLVVTHLQNEIATLAISGKLFEFSTSEINQYWQGKFLLLWKPPMLPIEVLRLGVTNEKVIWIRKHLNIIEGHDNDANTLSPSFDYALKQRVIVFQQQQKLTPDGAVGEQTMLALQAFSGEKPLLSSINP